MTISARSRTDIARDQLRSVSDRVLEQIARYGALNLHRWPVLAEFASGPTKRLLGALDRWTERPGPCTEAELKRAADALAVAWRHAAGAKRGLDDVDAKSAVHP